MRIPDFQVRPSLQLDSGCRTRTFEFLLARFLGEFDGFGLCRFWSGFIDFGSRRYEGVSLFPRLQALRFA